MTKSLRRVLVLGLVAAPMLLAPHAEARTRTPHKPIAVIAANQSSNWSGYNQGLLEPGKSGGFHQVSASWVVPTATQHKAGRAESSSVWVGIGGGCLNTACLLTDNTLIQAGSEQDVDAAGRASYSVWWEIIPVPSLTISSLHVKAGDTVFVDIREIINNSSLWTITVKVNGATFTQTVPYPSTHATVEWIAETPLVIGTNAGFAAMPNLSTVHFNGALANNANPGLVAAEQMVLVAGGQRLATPSAPSGGNSFSICTYSTSC